MITFLRKNFFRLNALGIGINFAIHMHRNGLSYDSIIVGVLFYLCILVLGYLAGKEITGERK